MVTRIPRLKGLRNPLEGAIEELVKPVIDRALATSSRAAARRVLGPEIAQGRTISTIAGQQIARESRGRLTVEQGMALFHAQLAAELIGAPGQLASTLALPLLRESRRARTRRKPATTPEARVSRIRKQRTVPRVAMAAGLVVRERGRVVRFAPRIQQLIAKCERIRGMSRISAAEKEKRIRECVEAARKLGEAAVKRSKR